MDWKQLFPKKGSSQANAWWAGDKPSRTGSGYGLLAQEGFENNVIVFRCISLIAKNAALPPWTLYKGEQELEDHFLLRLLNEPNPHQTRAEFLEAVLHFLLIDGNAFIEAVAADQSIERLVVHRPDRVRVLTDKAGDVCGYEIKDAAKTRRLFRDEDHRSPLLHIQLFHPQNAYYGLSPIHVAARAIDQHNAVGEHNLALLKNGGRPSGALMVPGSTQGFSTKRREELKKNLQYFYQGEHNAGKVLVLEGGMEWKDMGLSPKDLDFVAGKHLSTREIAQAFGVPPMLVGVPGESTFANYKEARFHLWEDTILPLLNRLVSHMNQWLVPLYGDDLRFDYNADQIPALTCRRERLWQQIQDASFLTLNEKRAALGYSPLPSGDQHEV